MRELRVLVGMAILLANCGGTTARPARGRRAADPSAFFDEAAAARKLGIGMTFHCEDCLQAVVPGPIQRQCAEAFIRGSHLQ